MEPGQEVRRPTPPISLHSNPDEETLYPRHLIQATGLNGEPHIPSIPGLKTFLGQTRHSTEFNTATVQDARKKIIVVSTGASEYDIADDLYRQSAHVTIIQRSPNFVISLQSVLAMMKTRYDEGKITEDSDLMMASMPATVFDRIGSEATRLF
jgi:putative flavoprotein involved in K+ transport